MSFPTRIIAVCAALLVTAAVDAGVVRAPHIEAELVAENTALKPGENRVALRLKPEAGWHTYWINPGDAGYATTLEWNLPTGFSASPMVWPHPELHTLGELTTYGYGAETLHRVVLTVPAGALPNQPVALEAKAKWLVCSEEVCIPGEAALKLTLPLSDAPTPDPRWAAAFADAREKTPKDADALKAEFSLSGKQLLLKVEGLSAADAARAQFFPTASNLVDHSARQHLAFDDRTLRFTQDLSTYLPAAVPQTISGVLVVQDRDHSTAYSINAVPGEASPPSSPAPGLASQGLPLILGFALLGGLILNLMPCVFPVLSLKALALVETREASRAENRAQALAYTAGVVISCAAVASVLIGLRAGGEAIGWGFQLQSPVFVGLMVYLLFALGLALSGVAEFGAGLMNLGDALTRSRGLAGSFFTGVLALVVASPCTAPFMGTALGFALTQSAPVALLIFSTLGLGLALPFLLLGFFPRLAGFLPKPGAWMLRFRQWMAFPLYLSAVWLLWVLMRQTGADAAALTLIGLVLIAFALTVKQNILKWVALAAALTLLWVAAQKPTVESSDPQAWSPARVAELRAQGRTIFVDFTADWCLTCKVNERVVLHTEAVQAAFAKNKVAFLVADWTNPDEAIAQELSRFNRPGVPMYLVYVNGGEPKLLPQVLTPDIVISALEN
ncbi:MAG: thioredoxin family protein [Pseudomonadota bacterium]